MVEPVALVTAPQHQTHLYTGTPGTKMYTAKYPLSMNDISGRSDIYIRENKPGA